MEYASVNNTKKKEVLEKKHNNILKKVEHYELLLSIPETHRWDPMDSKYSTYLKSYCINQLLNFIDKLKKEKNEYLFSSSYLYSSGGKKWQ